jgi:hypothetical protein
MRALLAILSVLLLCTVSAAAQQRTTLDIYVTDVEGGNATLFVTPAGESVLIDTAPRFDQQTDCSGCVCGTSGRSGSRHW